MSAKENIAKLPEWCFSKLLIDNSLIKISAGVMGYYPSYVPKNLTEENETVDQFADRMNADMGVTKGQRVAMESGSMFGWEDGAANLDNYNSDGSPTEKYLMSLGRK